MLIVNRRPVSQPQPLPRLDVGHPLSRGVIAWQTGVALNGFTDIGASASAIVPASPGVARNYIFDANTGDFQGQTKTVPTTTSPVTLIGLVRFRLEAANPAVNAQNNFLSLARPLGVDQFTLLAIYDGTNWRWQFAVYTSSPSSFRAISSTQIVDGDWHVVIGRQSSTTSRDLWVDGVLGGTNTLSGNPVSPNIVGIGEHDGSGWDGEIALSLVYNRALSNAEIAEVSRNPWQIFSQQKSYVPLPDPKRSGASFRLITRASQPQPLPQLDVGNPLSRGVIAWQSGVSLSNRQSYFYDNFLFGAVYPQTVPTEKGISQRYKYDTGGVYSGISTLNTTPTTLAPNTIVCLIKVDRAANSAAGATELGFAAITRFSFNNNGFYLGGTDDGTTSVFKYFVIASAVSASILSSTIPVDSNWHILVGRATSTTSRDFWIDGVLQASATTSIAPSLTGELQIGALIPQNRVSNTDIPLTVFYNRALSDREIVEISRNPWQIFTRSLKYLPPDPATLPIIARPSSDVTTTGWVPSEGSLLYPMINEVIPDNNTWIDSPVVDASPGPAVMGIDNSLTAGTIIVRVRAKKLANAGRFRVLLLDSSGSTVGTSSWQSVSPNIVDYAFSVVTSGTTARVQIEVAS